MTEHQEISGKLLIAILEKHKCDAAMTVARQAGASGGTILLGRGTAENKWLRMLGLDDVEKELLWTLLPASDVPAIMQALREAPSLAKVRGIMFTLDVHAVLRHRAAEVIHRLPPVHGVKGVQVVIHAPLFHVKHLLISCTFSPCRSNTGTFPSLFCP